MPEKALCAENVCRYIVPAEDMLKNGLELPPLAKLKIAQEKEKPSRGLYDRIEIAVGMKTMMLLNGATEADIAN